jgi:diguanylate cyclase (GGDEF)-like protein/PAS domain S-box-containing protein
MRKMQFFIIFSLLIFSLIFYKTYEQYQSISKTQNLIIENESKVLANFIMAFRRTYQDIFLHHQIEVTDKTLHLLPVKTTKEISQRFSKSLKGDIAIRTVSDRPRNPKNRANTFEMGMIDYFRKNPHEKERFIQHGDSYYYTKPLYIKSACLKCHGKREDTLPSIRKKYTAAYDYHLGELRGLMNIQIKKDNTFDTLYANFRQTVIGTVVIYILFLIIIYLLLQKMKAREKRYTAHLEAEIKEKTAEIEKQRDTFVTLFEKSSYGILIVKDNMMVECNEKLVEMFGYDSKKSLLSLSPSALSSPLQPDGTRSDRAIKKVILNAKRYQGYQFEWQNIKASGETFLSEVTITPVILDGEEVLHISIRDISEKKRVQEALIEQKNILHYQAHHDALTDLPNRILFNDRLEHGIKRAKHNNTMLALLFIDLDHFKKINDTLGHHIGDRVLTTVADRLKKKIHNEDTLARLGGDEFTVIIEDVKHTQDIQKLAQQIRTVLIEPISIDEHTLYISGSIGISIYPQDDTDPQNLIKYADAAMYRAKEEGRNTYQFYSKEMTTQALQRLMMESSMREALNNQEFRLYYQPQFNVKTGEVIGVEALIRWEHPELGMLAPGRFIPLAEESDLIIEIDRWVMKTAMQQLSDWYAKGYTPGLIALNLSMRQLSSSDFMELLEKYMDQTCFNPAWLELEVTEHQVMKRPDESIEKLQVLDAMGIKIAIDDFGTGYSSLAYLKRLPVSTLKIDQSFIRDIPEDKEDEAIVKAIIALAESLGMELIAEGVESEAQIAFLKENNCIQMQGYYYSRPLPAEEIERRFFMSHRGGRILDTGYDE